MRKWKRMLCVLIVAAIALPLMPNMVSARGGLDFIDYSRIKPAVAVKELTLVMGDVTIPGGKLQNKGKMTDEEIDQLIEEFIKENGYNPDDIRAWQEAVNTYVNTKEITKAEADKLVGALITITFAGTGGAGTVLSSLWALLTGDYKGAGVSMVADGAGRAGKGVFDLIANSEADSLLADEIINGGESVTGRLARGGGKLIGPALNIVSALPEIAESYNRRQYQLAARYAYHAVKGLLNGFYDALNDFLQEKNSKQGYHIVFAAARGDRPNFTFLGQAGCKQWWILDMELVKQGGRNEEGTD